MSWPRRRFLVSGGALLLAGGFGGCEKKLGRFPFRLTFTVDTPKGPVSASSVLAMSYAHHFDINGGGRRASSRLEGEATFIDVGPGPDGPPRHMIALLNGRHDEMPFLFKPPNAAANYDYIEAGGKLEGRQELPLAYRPMLVTFLDINDPASARVVYATGLTPSDLDPVTTRPKREPYVTVDRITETFGPGYAFKSASIEMMSASTPVTRGIEGRLPVVMGKLRELDKKLQVSRPNDPFKVGSGHLSIP